MSEETVLERSFTVDHLQCEGCKANIEQHLLALPGGVEAKVNEKTGEVCVRYDVPQVRFKDLTEVVEKAGFRRIFELNSEHHDDYLWNRMEETIRRML